MLEQKKKKIEKNIERKMNDVVVLSGDYVHTDPRIRKGFEILDKNQNIIFNGFNLKEEYDVGFKGDWQDDPRLKKYVNIIGDLIEKNRAKILYAHNTCENACKLAEEDSSGKYSKKYKIITSDFHVKRCKHIFRKFLHPYSTEFVGVQTARDIKELHRLKLHEIIQEFLYHYYFHGFKREDDPRKIKEIYNKRERKAKRILRKIFRDKFS